MKSDAPTSPIVFENYSAASQQRDSFFLGSMFLVLSLSSVALNFIWPNSGDGGVLMSFVAIGVGFYLLAIYQMITADRQKDKRIALIFDQEGVGGLNLFKNNDERLSWMRIQSVEIDGAAVVVQFEPKDLTSENPSDRRSRVRLSMANRQPEEIAATFDMFWERTN